MFTYTERKEVPIKWNGITYHSLEAMATALNIHPNTARNRLKAGYTQDSDVPKKGESNRKPVVWNGVHYPSITACAEANDVEDNVMSYRIRQGYTSEEDMKYVTK